MADVKYLKIPDGGKLAYCATEGAAPGVIFLGGFRSDMTGVKAIALEAFCKERGQAFIRFDYEGHGQSSGAFEDGTIGKWTDNAMQVLTKLTKGPQILVGSSMGGWIALLLAIAKPKRVAGIVGVAAAPDFTEHLIFEQLTPKQRDELLQAGKVMVPYVGAPEQGEPYPITKALIEDGRHHLLLGSEIPVNCPIRLLHGLKDDDVPWETSLSINEKVMSQDVKTILIENGNHRLSEPKDIEKLLRTVAKMLEKS